jgi:hypothetical protein
VTWHWEASGGFVSIGDVPFWETIKVTVTNHRDLPADVELVATMRRGHYEVDKLVCSRKHNGPEITGELIRSLPVARLLQEGAIKANSFQASPHADAAMIRKQGPTDESLRVVAQVYRLALAVRDDPTAAVASGLRLPRPTASRWVKTARQRGFLGPTEERRAGERKRR